MTAYAVPSNQSAEDAPVALSEAEVESVVESALDAAEEDVSCLIDMLQMVRRRQSG